MLSLRLFYPGLFLVDTWATGDFYTRGLNGPAARAPRRPAPPQRTAEASPLGSGPLSPKFDHREFAGEVI